MPNADGGTDGAVLQSSGEDCNAVKPKPKFERIVGKINSEWELRRVTELVAERDALKSYRETVKTMLHNRDFQSHSPELVLQNDMDTCTCRVLLPRWIMTWIEAGLGNKIGTLEMKLEDEYGIEQ